MRTSLAAAALAVGLTVLVGCEQEKPKAAGQGGSPPPVNSNADKTNQSRPVAPKGMAPPKRGGNAG